MTWHQPPSTAMTVRLLDPAAAVDGGLVEQLVALVNRVYATAESGLWRDDAARTSADEVAELIRSGEIAVATREGRTVGSVRVKEFLRAWYGRLGYRIVRTGRLDDAYPHLAPLLATPCDLEIHRKPLDSADGPQ